MAGSFASYVLPKHSLAHTRIVLRLETVCDYFAQSGTVPSELGAVDVLTLLAALVVCCG